MGFCSIDDINTFLGTNILPNDPQATLAIAEATAVIQNYCNQKIERVSNDPIFLDGTGSTKLFLPELPVNEIASVEVDGTLLDPAYYALAENGVLWRKYGVWTPGARNIKITYTHGYENIPEEIRGVCYRSAARLYQARLKATKVDFVGDVKSVSVGDYSISFGGGDGAGGEGQGDVSAARTLLMSEKDILNKYRYKRM